MGWSLELILYIGLLLGLLLGGMWLPFALGVSGVIAIVVRDGLPGLNALGFIAWGSATSSSLTAVPLFILMSEILLRSGVTVPLYRALARIVSRLPGGLLQTNIVACSMFAAICGSSVATAAAIGTVATPELAARHYNRRMSYGSLVAGGTLGILIPPSVPLIIYGTFTDTSVARLFMAGVVPGILLAIIFMLFIGGSCLLRPDLAGRSTEEHSGSALRTLGELLPFFVLMLMVLGGIYFGLTTATEAAGLGCIFALPIASFLGNMTAEVFATAVVNTVRNSCGLLAIILSAMIFAYSFENANLGTQLARWIVSLELSRTEFIFGLFVLYAIMGCVLESIAMIVITVPLFFPVVKSYGIDPVWFGVFVVVMIEFGQITPPFGINLFVIQGISGDRLGEVIAGAAPYFVIITVFVALLFAAPELVLWLPSQMFDR